VLQGEELDVAGERQHGPGRLRQHDVRDLVGIGHARVTGRHLGSGQLLDAAEELLVLQLLVAEPHQALQRELVAEPVVARQLQHLGVDEALDQAEQVGVGSALDLAQEALLVLRQEGELVRVREAVRQELVAQVEAPTADHVAIDLPAGAPGGGEAAREALAVGGGQDGLHGNGSFVLIGVGDERSSRDLRAPRGARESEERHVLEPISARGRGRMSRPCPAG
jgi:hypothetical protein